MVLYFYICQALDLESCAVAFTPLVVVFTRRHRLNDALARKDAYFHSTDDSFKLGYLDALAGTADSHPRTGPGQGPGAIHLPWREYVHNVLRLAGRPVRGSVRAATAAMPHWHRQHPWRYSRREVDGHLYRTLRGLKPHDVPFYYAQTSGIIIVHLHP